jgi:hypothetical protein
MYLCILKKKGREMVVIECVCGALKILFDSVSMQMIITFENKYHLRLRVFRVLKEPMLLTVDSEMAAFLVAHGIRALGFSDRNGEPWAPATWDDLAAQYAIPNNYFVVPFYDGHGERFNVYAYHIPSLYFGPFANTHVEVDLRDMEVAYFSDDDMHTPYEFALERMSLTPTDDFMLEVPERIRAVLLERECHFVFHVFEADVGSREYTVELMNPLTDSKLFLRGSIL